jgi:RNA polymerase sigma-70 factor, ECF subfamily
MSSEREIFRCVAALVPNAADAEYIVQQTATALRERSGVYDPSQPFTPWACRFALSDAELLELYAKGKPELQESPSLNPH